jgi:hypothetical protein
VKEGKTLKHSDVVKSVTDAFEDLLNSPKKNVMLRLFLNLGNFSNEGHDL